MYHITMYASIWVVFVDSPGSIPLGHMGKWPQSPTSIRFCDLSDDKYACLNDRLRSQSNQLNPKLHEDNIVRDVIFYPVMSNGRVM